jgi:hypothetical protein
VVEGMLERVQVLLSGSDVDRVVAALEQQWAENQERLALKPTELRAAAQAHRKQRQRLVEATRTRIVAGYIELLAGTPATLAEAQVLRRERQRERQQGQRARATPNEATNKPSTTGEDTQNASMQPDLDANMPGDGAKAATTRAGRPRRRVAEGSSMEEATDSTVATDHDPTQGSEI